jgi:integrase
MARRTRWSYSEGAYKDVRVLVYDGRGGMLYGMVRDGSRVVEPRHSLGHRDRARAITWAKQHHDHLRQGVSSPNVPTAGRVFDLYLARQREVYPDVTSRARKGQERGATFWRVVLGPACHLEDDLDGDTLDRIGRKRRRGEIDAQGSPVAAKDRQPVGPRTFAADLEWLRACLLWAVTKLVRGAPLLKRNAMAGYTLPTEANPRRPVVTPERYAALQQVAAAVTMEPRIDGKRVAVRSYLPELLALAHHTGRRIGAIVLLRYHDLRLSQGPHGAIEWPGDTDKMGRTWTAPLNTEARAAVDRILKDRPGLGAAYLFPSPRNPRRAVSVDLASDWLERAEQLAELPSHEGSLWHAFRRGWATARKNLPAQDVAAAGGWSDLTCLQTAYQQPDTETMQRVVEGGI